MNGLPQALPNDVFELVDQLAKLNPPPTIEGPTNEDQIHLKLVECGRHQVAQELKILADNARHG
tara:strand:+ start:1270 stop:1461 length:192 start_codon:yes stop_codon:yes gene_type:complete